MVSTPLKHMSSSVGITIPNRWGNNNNNNNKQPLTTIKPPLNHHFPYIFPCSKPPTRIGFDKQNEWIDLSVLWGSSYFTS